jgi:hypothetical protein
MFAWFLNDPKGWIFTPPECQFSLISCCGVRQCTWYAGPLFGLLDQPRMIDDDEREAVGRMRIGKGKKVLGKIPAPLPIGSQIAHHTTQVRTRALAV